MNTLVLAIDRLHAGYLGPYGNGWVGTPCFNRLAAQGFTFDQALSDSPRLEDFYTACFTGRHALQTARTDLAARAALPTIVDQSLHRRMTIVTDAPLPTLPGTPEVIDVAGAAADETRLAQFFAAAIETIAGLPRPFFAWLHTGALGAAWDAPLEYRNRYADPDEAPPPTLVDVPKLVLPAHYDPDELLGYCLAYAGQVRLLDECLAGLIAFLEEQSLLDDTLIVLLAPRGMALGEHRRIGAWDAALHSETIHLPWLLRLPGGLGAACRSQALVQPPDLFATLSDWLPWTGGDEPRRSLLEGGSLLPIIHGQVASIRDRCLALAENGERGFRIPQWYLRTLANPPVEPDAAAPGWQLYAKPDDRWEVNDVAVRLPEIVELLLQAQDDLLNDHPADARGMPALLDDVLTTPWR